MCVKTSHLGDFLMKVFYMSKKLCLPRLDIIQYNYQNSCFPYVHVYIITMGSRQSGFSQCTSLQRIMLVTLNNLEFKICLIIAKVYNHTMVKNMIMMLDLLNLLHLNYCCIHDLYNYRSGLCQKSESLSNCCFVFHNVISCHGGGSCV